MMYSENESEYCHVIIVWPGKAKTKAELPKVGIFFALNFFPGISLWIKKLKIEKTKTTNYTAFKTGVIKVVLVFLISNYILC